MAKALTVRTIETLKPGTGRREVPDGIVHGLYLVMQPSGATSWAVRYRHAGASRKLTLGAYPAIDLKNARELASAALVAVARGDDPAGNKKEAKRAIAATRPTHDLIENVCAAYIERQAKPNTREASWREVERILKREVIGSWAGRRLGDISRADIHVLLDGIVDRSAPVLANRTLAALRRVCNWAIGRGIIEASPCDRVKAPVIEQTRDRVLSDDEIRLAWQVFEGAGWPFGNIAQLLLLTGARRDEVGQMTWAEVDFTAPTWTIAKERSKNGQAHELPLSHAALRIIESLPRVGDGKGLIFTTNGKTPASGYSRAKLNFDKAILEGMREASSYPNGVTPPERWTLHDLRRTAASGMAGLGIAPHIVEAVLNHVSGHKAGIAGIYNRATYGKEKREALDVWANHIAVILAQADGANIHRLQRA
jgi:integrase